MGRWLRRTWPVLAVLALLLALMYPVALFLGMPLARERMENLSNWDRATVTELPAAEASASGESLRLGDSPGALRLLAQLEPGTAVLVRDTEVLATGVSVEDGSALLAGPLPGDAAVLGDALVPTDAPGDDLGGRVFAFEDPASAGAPLYLDGRLLDRASVPAVERADGARTEFTVPLPEERPGERPGERAEERAEEGEEPAVAIVGGVPLLEGEGFELEGDSLTFTAPPAFNAAVLLVTGDYEYLDTATGEVVMTTAPPVAPRPATSYVALVEGLLGERDGGNSQFRLQHVPLVERDDTRRIFLDGTELSGEAQRPEERVDGTRATFTFAADRGIVTIDGRELVEGTDYERDGPTVTFTSPPPRNAAVRQHPDYRVSDPATGTITLAVAPASGQALWASSYTYYEQPGCGATALECFFAMPQHPVPFPNWIAERLVPFFTTYPLSDSRNVIRATLYTAAGTLISLAVGTVIGVLLAVLFVRVRPFEQALLPWVIASQTIPVIALVPVLVAVLGNIGITVQTSLVPAAIVGAYIAFFPITVGTVTGLRSVDPLALDLMKAYAASPVQSFLKLRFPAAVPYLFTSLKLGAAAALVGALVAEVESNNRLGLGYAIIGQVQAGDVADVWILLGVSALLGIALVSLVGLLQRLLAPWQRTGLAAGEEA